MREPVVTQLDRRNILRRHYPIGVRYHEGGEGGYVEELAEPICANCFEPWGAHGCSTTRAVFALGIIEAAWMGEKEYADRVARKLSEIAIKGEWRSWKDPGMDVLECRLQVARHIFAVGGMPVIHETLARMYEEFEKEDRKLNPPPGYDREGNYSPLVEMAQRMFDPTRGRQR